MEGMHEVIGWFDLQALLVLRLISARQLANGVQGSVVEIGVHHGKSLAALCLLNRDLGGGKLVAVDVFEDQVLNTDASGEGDHAEMERTLERWCGKDMGRTERFSVLAQDSRSVSAQELIASGGGQRVRLFSVDGSHTAEATLSDMRLVQRLSPVPSSFRHLARYPCALRLGGRHLRHLRTAGL